MDINLITSAAMARIINDDKDDQGRSTMHDLLDTPIQAVKGPRKRTGMTNPCFTVHVLSNPRNEDTKAHNGTMVVNFYADDHTEGHAHIELLGPVANRLIQIFDDIPLEVTGYVNYNLSVAAPEGPLSQVGRTESAGEHFMSVRINFGIIERS